MFSGKFLLTLLVLLPMTFTASSPTRLRQRNRREQDDSSGVLSELADQVVEAGSVVTDKLDHVGSKIGSKIDKSVRKTVKGVGGIVDKAADAVERGTAKIVDSVPSLNVSAKDDDEETPTVGMFRSLSNHSADKASDSGHETSPASSSDAESKQPEIVATESPVVENPNASLNNDEGRDEVEIDAVEVDSKAGAAESESKPMEAKASPEGPVAGTGSVNAMVSETERSEADDKAARVSNVADEAKTVSKADPTVSASRRSDANVGEAENDEDSQAEGAAVKKTSASNKKAKAAKTTMGDEKDEGGESAATIDEMSRTGKLAEPVTPSLLDMHDEIGKMMFSFDDASPEDDEDEGAQEVEQGEMEDAPTARMIDQEEEDLAEDDNVHCHPKNMHCHGNKKSSLSGKESMEDSFKPRSDEGVTCLEGVEAGCVQGEKINDGAKIDRVMEISVVDDELDDEQDNLGEQSSSIFNIFQRLLSWPL